MTEWILFLACNVLFCIGFVIVGTSIQNNPENDRSVPLAYRSKTMPEGDEAWNAGQKLFGSVLIKGGCALIIINFVIMLCVLSASQTILNIAGLSCLILEIVYYSAARIYTAKMLKKRFETETVNEPSPKPAASALPTENSQDNCPDAVLSEPEKKEEPAEPSETMDDSKQDLKEEEPEDSSPEEEKPDEVPPLLEDADARISSKHYRQASAPDDKTE